MRLNETDTTAQTYIGESHIEKEDRLANPCCADAVDALEALSKRQPHFAAGGVSHA
jgi:hypothetical protein